MDKKLEEKTEDKTKELPKAAKKVVLSPEHFASRQRAHELKVAKFLAGGEY